MRKFRSSIENLRDIRIAYTFLLSLAVVATLLGILASNRGESLKERRLASLRSSLSLCADSLKSFGAEDSLRTAARFSSAISKLPPEVDLTPLSRFSESIEKGEATPEAVRAFTDTFSLLAALHYETPEAAEEITAETIGRVCGEVCPDFISSPPDTAVIVPPEVAVYNRKVARKTVDSIFGLRTSALKVDIEEGAPVAKTGNMRLRFSADDGSLEEFVYIRLNDFHSEKISEQERIDAALSFFTAAVRHRGEPEAAISGEVCGFLVVELSSEDEKWRVAVDEGGKVWSFFKSAG